jgi:hypothetical protein
MDVRAGFYKHPYATMVTGVFLFSLLVTVLYFFGLISGEPKTLLTITGVLLIATAATWITAISLSSDDG